MTLVARHPSTAFAAGVLLLAFLDPAMAQPAPAAGFQPEATIARVDRVRLISLVRAGNRLVAAGFAEFRPLADGDSPDDLRRNRRIELKLDQR